jgi:hypothetical protein
MQHTRPAAAATSERRHECKQQILDAATTGQHSCQQHPLVRNRQKQNIERYKRERTLEQAPLPRRVPRASVAEAVRTLGLAVDDKKPPSVERDARGHRLLEPLRRHNRPRVSKGEQCVQREHEVAGGHKVRKVVHGLAVAVLSNRNAARLGLGDEGGRDGRRPALRRGLRASLRMSRAKDTESTFVTLETHQLMKW